MLLSLSLSPHVVDVSAAAASTVVVAAAACFLFYCRPVRACRASLLALMTK